MISAGDRRYRHSSPYGAAPPWSGCSHPGATTRQCAATRELRCDGIVVDMSGKATEMVTIPWAELDALKAELSRLRLAAGREAARAQILADPGPGHDAPVFTREKLAEAWDP